MTKPVLIIHGGAGKKSKNERRQKRLRQKIKHFLDLSYSRLADSRALDVVTYAVKLLEDDPDFNAGTGSLLQHDGRARLSASVMDGAKMRFSAVINIEKMKNPVLVANTLLDCKSRVLSGQEATAFAKKRGFALGDPRTKRAIKRWKKGNARGCDTVGACALDRHGNLACATSTGGRGFEQPGRVSDSGMPVGNFADHTSAISATGIGEDIMDEGLAVRIAQRVQDGMTLNTTFQKTFQELRRRKRHVAAIGLDRLGRIAIAKTSDVLIYGWQKGKLRKIF